MVTGEADRISLMKCDVGGEDALSVPVPSHRSPVQAIEFAVREQEVGSDSGTRTACGDDVSRRRVRTEGRGRWCYGLSESPPYGGSAFASNSHTLSQD